MYFWLSFVIELEVFVITELSSASSVSEDFLAGYLKNDAPGFSWTCGMV